MIRARPSAARSIGGGPRAHAAYVPAISVALASLLSAAPIVSTTGWLPNLPFLMLIAWRLLRADVWPAWWAAPLGLLNDLLSGSPIGFSVTIWTASMLALELLDRRTMWRDYWIEWGLAAILIAIHELFEWWIAALMGAPLPTEWLLPPILLSVLFFPLVGWFVGQLDRWRLRR